MFYDDHSLGSSSLCACVYMLFLCNWILLFVYFLVFVFVFFRWPYKLKKKGNKNETYSDVSDFLLIFLKLNNFVLLADSLPIFLVVCHALEVVGGA